jgi:ethanolamine ammonia-lyase small subunit
MSDLSARNERNISFLGEQDGEPERRLKAALRERLRESKTVTKAYLARVRYGTASATDVALALLAPGANGDTVVNAVQAEFRAQFNATQHLDIFFLTPELDTQVSRVCQPFFVAEATEPTS